MHHNTPVYDSINRIRYACLSESRVHLHPSLHPPCYEIAKPLLVVRLGNTG